MSKKANPSPPVPVRGPLVLLALALAECGLAIFQWLQLLTLRGGGATVCGVSERVNCETVWNSSFATSVHDLLGMPVAALGLVWGLTAAGLAGLYLAWRRARRTVRPAINGLRLVAAAGVAACLVFALASASSGALCPTCLGTYALVLAFAAAAWKGLEGPLLPQRGEWGRALGWTVGLAGAAYLALLVPGLATPRAPTGAAAPLGVASGDPSSLEGFLGSLSPQDQQDVADALARYRSDAPLPAPSPARRLHGSPSAPVKVVEWTDSKCPHCKLLVEALAELKRRVSAERMSLEVRQFPLDPTCNASIPRQYADGVALRCTAAKAQICLEQAPDFWALREKLFAAQEALRTNEQVLEIASSGSVPRAALETCIASAETAAKLQEDVAYAKQHDIHGTPLVVVNGREVPPSPSFLYALAMTGGDASAPAFRVLPAPRPQRPHQH